MNSLTEQAIIKITKYIAEKFDKLSFNFLGLVPKLKDKRIIISAKPNSLSSLFLNVLGHKPNKSENEAMKSLMFIANSYINGLKEQTTARIVSEIDGYLRQQSFKDGEGKSTTIQDIISKEMDTASKKIEVVVGSESNKVINVATALQIKQIGEEQGISDPVVFFSPVLDERNDPETFRLHLLPDRKTPRCYFLSEVQGGYHHRGDKFPKFAGTSPNCRCKLTLLTPGYGWKNGHLSYISPNYNALVEQRKEFAMPE